MVWQTALQEAWRVTVYCPVSGETLAAVARGELEALSRDPLCGPVLAYLERCAELGNFGRYRGVCEIALGVEAFTPVASARPALGRTGERTHSATVAVTTYIRNTVPAERRNALVGELAALHPWEVPVIEVVPVELAARVGS